MLAGGVEAKAERIEAAARVARAKAPPETAPQIEALLRQYYAAVPAEDLSGWQPGDVYGAVLAHWDLARTRPPGAPKVRVYTPQFEQHGWQSTHTAVEVVTDDMPFLVDSVRNEINRHGLGIHLVLHPIVQVRRNESDDLVEVLPPGPPAEDTISESYLHFEVDRLTQPDLLSDLHDDIVRILGDVRAAVEDWEAMLDQLRHVLTELEVHPPRVDEEELAEAVAFLAWLADGNFTFLGYRDYKLSERGGEDVIEGVVGSGLGILRARREEPSAISLAKLPPEVGRHAREPNLLVLTKANSRATVHRPSRLDYIGIKQFDRHGRVIGERRFLGLYTSTAYSASATEIPVLRRKFRQVVERSGFPPGVHSRKDLETVLENFPRDEFFQSPVGELYDTAMGILHLQERQRVRLFVRRDTYGRFFSCLVFLPRERYNTDSRKRVQQILTESLHGVDVEYTTQVSESVLARLHYVVYTEPSGALRIDPAEIESKIAAAIRTWTDNLKDALLSELGEERGMELLRVYGEAFPPGYRDATAPRRAVADIEHLEELGPDGDLRMSLYRLLEAPAGTFRFKIYRSGGRITLSEMLPRLENMGVEVIEEHPHEVRPAEGETRWVYDLGLSYGAIEALDAEDVRRLFQDAFAKIWTGAVEDDRFNRLVLAARLDWRDIGVLRAYSKYLRQTGSLFSQAYVEDTLVGNPHIARKLVDLFHARFDPSAGDRRTRSETLGAEILAALDEVESLDEDRILRSYLALIEATLRTNCYQKERDGSPRERLVFKFDPREIPDLPLPRPAFEIFVYSPRTEGVHLRAGKVARGGIRWSDRREDFRTEILGLMKAQQVKNAIIIPVGAKGGFVVKRPPATGGRDALFAEVQSCYRTFISGLLDVTDNLVDGKVVSPDDVVRYDEDDTYLVVAADKGTATFSDVANAISADHGFWLGDAFASGGSRGYDHKKMGITARGAWESIKHHFRELGTDVQSTDFTAVGIGDMSGDVFGNGMLLSHHIKLVAAFDHRHIFIDPDPDPETSFTERARLFSMPRSSWDDYDRSKLSAGGGIYPRAAKSIRLSDEARRALGTTAEGPTPAELASVILRAPVDLFFNGGIGTFVKASDETHAEAGDRTNDGIRVDATQLRCRVVGEGGNLGFTQRARIEYALSGGRINTDSIDNSAGVDCSDHEVNIKILLDGVVAAGDMTGKQRNELLAEMTDEVAELVLRDNHDQARALGNSLSQAAAMIDVHDRYIHSLEQAGKLDRQLEFLPDEEAIAERRSDGRGLTSPEFAVLLAYTKMRLEEELLASDVPEDPYLGLHLERYFPTRLRRSFAGGMRDHALRREIIATRIANEMVNAEGITFVFRLGEETGAPAAEIARAHTVASEVFDSGPLRADIESLGLEVPAAVGTQMILDVRKLTERGTRWLLRHCPTPLDVSAAVELYRPRCRTLAERFDEVLMGSDRRRFEETTAALEQSGVPTDLARRVARCALLISALDLVEVARATEEPVEAAAAIHFRLGDELRLGWLRDQILALPRSGRWQALARDALRGDLSGWHSALTAEVMDSSGDRLPAEERITAWLEGNRRSLARYRALLADIEVAQTADLATLSVALREVRSLVGAGRRPPAARA